MEAVPVKFVPRGYGDTYRRDAWWVEPLVVFMAGVTEVLCYGTAVVVEAA